MPEGLPHLVVLVRRPTSCIYAPELMTGKRPIFGFEANRQPSRIYDKPFDFSTIPAKIIWVASVRKLEYIRLPAASPR